MFDFLITKFAIFFIGIILSFSVTIYVIMKKIISFINEGMTINNGKALHWNKSDIPLTVVHENLPDLYIEVIKSCCYRINSICEKKIFNLDVKSLPCILNECKPIKILFVKSNNNNLNQCDEYYINYQWNKKTGQILTCKVFIRDDFYAFQLRNIIRHVLGRILGLKCNYLFNSIMCKKSIRKQLMVDFSDRDRKIIRRHYG